MRKNHHATKRAKRLLGNVRIWSWESDQEDSTRSLYAQAKQPLGWLPLNQKDISHIANNPNNWVFSLRLIRWYPDGNVDIDTATAYFWNTKLAHLENEAKAMRKLLLAKAKREHIVDVGWTATSFVSQPRNIDTCTMLALGSITEPRQFLWNYATNEDLKESL